MWSMRVAALSVREFPDTGVDTQTWDDIARALEMRSV